MAALVATDGSLQTTLDRPALTHGQGASTLPRSGSTISIQTSALSVDAFAFWRGAVLKWVYELIQKPSEADTTEESAWNGLRFGIELCELMNVLSPGSVAHFQASKGVNEAIENLRLFINAAHGYGLDKRYTFRPEGFVQGDPKGDEAALRFLIALILEGIKSKGAPAKNFPMAEAEELVQSEHAKGPTPGLTQVRTADSAHSLVAPWEDSGIVDTKGRLEKVLTAAEVLELASARCWVVGGETAGRLRNILAGALNPSNRKHDSLDPSAHSVLSKLEATTEALISNLDSLLRQFNEIDATQKEALSAIGAPPFIERMNSVGTMPRPASIISPADTEQPDTDGGPVLSTPIPTHPHALHFLGQQTSTASIQSDTSNLSSVDLHALMKSDPNRASLIPEMNTLNLTLNRNRLSGDQQLLAGTPTTPQSPASAATPATPKMFAKLPPEVLAANLPKNEMMRLCAVYELIETEADYVRDLQTMINYHQEEIKKTKLLSDEDINLLFSNVDQLVPVNQHLLNRLTEKRDTDPFIPEVGDALVDVSESFKVYTQYCANYPQAMKLLYSLQPRADFKDHLQTWMNSTEGRGLSLESFLIKPVQRICKYPLLIRELQKHTDKLSKDTISLNLAMEKIEAVVSEVNEGTRQLGERERLTTLEKKIESPMPLNLGTLRHVRDGVVQRIQTGKTKERYILLFAEVLLILKQLKGGKYQLEGVSDMGEMVIKPDGKGDAIPRGARNAWQVLAVGERKDTFVFSATSEEERTKWVEAFIHATKLANTPDREGRKPSAIGGLMERHFNDTIEGKGTIRFMSGTIRKPTHSRTPSSGSLRPKAWGGSIRKKGVDFANENSILETIANMSDNDIPIEPDMVESNGQVWKRTTSAMGPSYYYNPQTKETSWRLPEVYTVLDPATGKPLTAEEELPMDDEEDLMDEDLDDEMVVDQNVELVEGYPDWRRVERDGVTYWCNVATMESRWEPPGPGDESHSGEDQGVDGNHV